MEQIRIARQIILGYLNKITNLTETEKLCEIALVNTNDEVLLEHINIAIDVLTNAKKEIEKNTGK